LRQPKDALTPTAFSVEAAEKWALERAATLPDDPFRLLALWSVSFLVQADPSERKTRYTMRIAQADGYGRSGGLGPGLPDPDPDLVGQDTRRILKDRRWRDEADHAAIADLVIGQVSRPADERIVLDNTLREKYVMRTMIFADEAERVLRRRDSEHRKVDRPRVLVVGATAGILAALARRGLAVCATDLSPDVVGQTLGGVPVLDGRTATPGLMKDADLTIVTGMSLTNGTLPELMSLAKTHNTSTIIWAITGKNFGHYYTEHGVDSVISDPSPFLLLPGPATIAIWRQQV
jgi:Putative heavy-metal chelation